MHQPLQNTLILSPDTKDVGISSALTTQQMTGIHKLGGIQLNT